MKLLIYLTSAVILATSLFFIIVDSDSFITYYIAYTPLHFLLVLTLFLYINWRVKCATHHLITKQDRIVSKNLIIIILLYGLCDLMLYINVDFLGPLDVVLSFIKLMVISLSLVTVYFVSEYYRTSKITLIDRFDFMKYHEVLTIMEDNNKAGYWKYDIKHNDLYWSRGMYNIYGSMADLDAVKTNIHKNDVEKYDNAIASLIGGEKKVVVTYRYIINNQHKYLRVTCFLGDNDIAYGITEDITGEIRITRENEKLIAAAKLLLADYNNEDAINNFKNAIENIRWTEY
jgi:hypothetical protein